jgi:hypothetical protein
MTLFPPHLDHLPELPAPNLINHYKLLHELFFMDGFEGGFILLGAMEIEVPPW